MSLKSRLRQRFRTGNVWRLNLNRNEGGSLADMTELCFERSEISISDWRLRDLGQPFVELPSDEESVEVTVDRVAEQYRDDITGEIDWDSVRDVLHEEKYADSHDTKIKAGNAAGCIRRFLFDASENDTVLINSSRGTAMAVVDGRPIYQPSQEQAEVDPHHVFRRSVTLMHDEEGDIITFDNSELPQPLKPNKMTMTSVNRDDLHTVLAQAEALTTLADTLSLVDKAKR